MGIPLSVLILEDSPVDAELVALEVRRAGFEVEWARVDTEADYLSRLDGNLDIILSDYRIPGFGGEQALELLKTTGLDIPFIVVTGTLGDEKAVDLIKRGAADFILKDNMVRLGEAVKRALGERQLRFEKYQVEQALQESEERYRDLVEHSHDLICTHDLDGNLLSVNEAAVQLTGYSREILLTRNMADLLMPRSRRLFASYLKKIRAIGRAHGMMLIETASGETRTWEYDNSLRTEGKAVPIVRGMARDITERKNAEQALQKRAAQLALVNEISKPIAALLDLPTLFSTAVRLIRERFGYQHVGLFTVDRERGQVIMMAREGMYSSMFPPNHSLKLGVGLVGWAAEQGSIMLANDVAVEPRFSNPFPDQIIRAEVSVPIKIGTEIVGVLDLQSKERDAFDTGDLLVLETLADQIAVAMQNAKLYQELGSKRDSLQQAVKDRTSEIENMKDRLESILDNCPDPIILLDRYGAIESANPAFYQLFRADKDNLYKLSLPELVEPPQAEAVRYALHQVMVKRKTQRLEATVRRTDDTSFDADFALAIIRQGSRIKGAVCIVRDISALKEVDRLKDEFVANVSHELRTPITGIKLNHDLLSRDPARKDVYMGRLKREVDRLNELIEDLLRLSRLDRGRVEMRLETIDLNVLVAQYVSDRFPLAASRQLDLQSNLASDKQIVTADEGLLGQVLSILLTNAFNYTLEGGQVVIQTHRRTNSEGTWAGFSVKDTGQGILPVEQERLFERFFRGSAGQASGAAGTGLGLAIAREIVDKHKGVIEIASEGIPGKGSTIMVWLPAASQAGD